MTVLPGISGSLFPSRFLAGGFTDAVARGAFGPNDESRRRLIAWWQRVEANCGPATGLRTLFDLAAMPLVSVLGFRAHDAVFDRLQIQACLRTKRGTNVGLLVLPWASRPSQLWRRVASTTREIGADWCLLLALPFVSLVDGRGRSVRRSLDFTLPNSLHERSLTTFWTLCAAGAFDRGTFDGRQDVTPLDLLTSRAERFQDAVRRDLQSGVVTAISAIAPILNEDRARGPSDRFGEALTLVYRVLFLLFAESRELLPHRHPAYGRAYALSVLCREAVRHPRGCTGSWDGLAAITRLSRSGCDTEELIVRPFNGRLFAKSSAPSLEARAKARTITPASRRRDAAMTAALVALGTRPGQAGREEISYADLGVEQLGAVYERVLDLDPDAIIHAGALHSSTGNSKAGHSRRRKETGTFYTPQPLAEFVVRRTLTPLIRGATTDQILALRIVDPAMGSGAFLVAACRFLAHAYETALVEEGRCAETDLDPHARASIRRTIAVRCLAGVDANPVAVQLARLSLWLTTLARDKPLTFLDHRLRVGNSLLGTSPDSLWRLHRRTNKRHSIDATPLLDSAGFGEALRDLAPPLKQLRDRSDDTVADVRARERLWAAISGDRSPLEPWRLACNLWSARWFWPKTDAAGPPSPAEVGATIDAILRHDRTLSADRLSRRIEVAKEVARSQQFFHWPLEFADVFYDDTGAPRQRPGFDAVIGNPPWEMLRRDEDAGATTGEPESCARTVEFVRQSGEYPSCDRGHLNLYQPFVERSLSIARAGGRVGLVLPWGFASDEGARSLRSRVILKGGVDSIVGLDNAAGIFPIHRGLRFLVLVASPNAPARDIRARFGVRDIADIDELPGEDDAGDGSAFPVRLSADTIRIVGGPSLRIPDARLPGELDWLRRVSCAFPRLGDRAGWAVEFSRELNATEDRESFGTKGLVAIDGKHLSPFAVRPETSTRRISESAARRILPDQRFARARLAYRDVSGAANRFTLIAAIVPPNVVTTHTLFCLRTPLDLVQQRFLCGLFNSATLNAIVRMLMGGHVTTQLVEGLPIPAWTGSPEQLRIAELGAHLEAAPADGAAMNELNAITAKMYRQL